jgi:hypothetical protein
MFEHDPFGKPASTFPDHALARFDRIFCCRNLIELRCDFAHGMGDGIAQLRRFGQGAAALFSTWKA